MLNVVSFILSATINPYLLLGWYLPLDNNNFPKVVLESSSANVKSLPEIDNVETIDTLDGSPVYALVLASYWTFADGFKFIVLVISFADTDAFILPLVLIAVTISFTSEMLLKSIVAESPLKLSVIIKLLRPDKLVVLALIVGSTRTTATPTLLPYWLKNPSVKLTADVLAL